MTKRAVVLFIVTVLCAGCSLKLLRDIMARLAYENVSNPWIVKPMRYHGRDYMGALYDPRPLGPELCTAARILIPTQIGSHDWYQHPGSMPTIAFSPCDHARAEQFVGLEQRGNYLFSGDEIHAALLDVDAVLTHGEQAVPGVEVEGTENCKVKPTINWNNFERVKEAWSYLQVDFAKDKSAPDYVESYPTAYVEIFVDFENHHVDKMTFWVRA